MNHCGKKATCVEISSICGFSQIYLGKTIDICKWECPHECGKNTQLNNISPERCIGQMLEISMKTERETFGNTRRGLENSDYTGRLK